MPDQITAPELKAALEKGEKLVLIDVREQPEFDYTHLAGSKNVPLNQLPGRVGELDAKASCVVICHHGVRSARAAGFLLQNGFSSVKNLVGGLAAYAQVDPAIKHY